MPRLNLDSNEPSSRFSRVRLTRFSSSGVSLPKVLLAISFAFLLFLGSTFAANINLNNNQSVEFGQGVVQTVACDDAVTITPYSSFVNESGGGSFKFTSISVTGIGEECNGRVFTIKAYKNGQDAPLPLYVTGGSTTYDQLKVADTAGTFSLVEAGLDSNDIEQLADESGFLVTLYTSDPPGSVAASDANDVDRITIESNVGSGESPSPSPSPTSSSFSFGDSSSLTYYFGRTRIGQTFKVPSSATTQLTGISNLRIRCEYQGFSSSSGISLFVRVKSEPNSDSVLAQSAALVIPGLACDNSTISIASLSLASALNVIPNESLYFEVFTNTPDHRFYLGDSFGYDRYGDGDLYFDRNEGVSPINMVKVEDIFGSPCDTYFTLNFN